jgi:hypothetical protein
MAGQRLVRRRITLPRRRTLRIGEGITVTFVRENANATVTLEVESPADQPPIVHDSAPQGRKPLRRRVTPA